MLHQRYGSKDLLWYAAVDRGFKNLLGELLAAMADAGDDPLDQLRAAMLRFLTSTRANPGLIQIINQESARPGPRYEHLFNHYIAPINEGGLRPLRQLQAQGIIRQGPVTTIFFYLTTYGLGLMSSHPGSFKSLGDDPVDQEEAAALAVDMILNGLRPRP
jgi:AcrR family transcriptional regulator